jgi:hypothetical protein
LDANHLAERYSTLDKQQRTSNRERATENEQQRAGNRERPAAGRPGGIPTRLAHRRLGVAWPGLPREVPSVTPPKLPPQYSPQPLPGYVVYPHHHLMFVRRNWLPAPRNRREKANAYACALSTSTQHTLRADGLPNTAGGGNAETQTRTREGLIRKCSGKHAGRGGGSLRFVGAPRTLAASWLHAYYAGFSCKTQSDQALQLGHQKTGPRDKPVLRTMGLI